MNNTVSLKKNRDFQYMYDYGSSYANRYLVMFVIKNDELVNHLGISVSKKVGNSVIRHRVKRLIKEAYRLHEDEFNSGLNIVVIARSTASSVGYKEIESALLHVANLHKIIS